jgi:hypothetical protein
MFADPVTRLDVVDPLIAGIPEGSSLLGRKIPPLSFSDPVQLLLSLIRGLHNGSTFLAYYAARSLPEQGLYSMIPMMPASRCLGTARKNRAFGRASKIADPK